MIDLHCHILPGIDDGPATLEESLAMCRIASADGIETIVATPHFRPGRFNASSHLIRESLSGLDAAVQQEGMRLRILPGAEVAISPELPHYLETAQHLAINNGRYFLAELPPDGVLPRWDSFLLSLTKSGKTPILAHPERNPWFWSRPEALYSFVGQGGVVQITAQSLTGFWGEEARDFSRLLLEHNLVHVLGTDAHDARYRAPVLSFAAKQAEQVIGRERALAIVSSIPRAIINGTDVLLPEPIPVVYIKKRRKLFTLFP
jgi:protein-tyrosine phosphatase